MFEKLHPYLISLTVGLIIGIERERTSKTEDQVAGVRTFMLVALLGTLASDLRIVYLSLGICIFVIGVILAGYLRSTRKAVKNPDFGLTTEISLMIVFGLGALARFEAFLSLILGIAVLTVLYSREWLHKFSKEILKPKEIQAVILILIFSVAIPFFPNRAIDPFGFLNPQKLFLIFVALVMLQFSSYVLNRALGEKGLMLAGFLGGFVSSTGVFASLPQIIKAHPDAIAVTTSAAILATCATLIEVLFVVVVASSDLFITFSICIAPMIVVGLLLAKLMGRKAALVTYKLSLQTPLELKSVTKLFAFICGIFFIIAIVQKSIGSGGMQIVTFLGGLFELQSVVFASINLFTEKKIIFNEVFAAVSLAILGSFVSKFALLLFFDRGKFFYLTSAILVLMLLVGGAGYWSILHFMN